METTQKKNQEAEMETFLPNSNHADGTTQKYKPTIVPAKQNSEALQIGDKGDKLYELFRQRNNPNPTTDWETFVHLLKASLGSGILSMPLAFKSAGLATGLVATLVTAFMCTYCSYVLVKCAHSLYRRLHVPNMSYADVAEQSFAQGPRKLRAFSKVARMCVIYGLFITYFGAISCYTVIAGRNFQEVVEHYTMADRESAETRVRWYILATLPPLLALGFIPNLKALAPFSLVANILIGSGLGITVYHLVEQQNNPWKIRQTPISFYEFPATFSITAFAMEAIGLMMPLENNMRSPTHFLGLCGVLNLGMSVVSMVYILIGVLGYLRYGDATTDNISANLDITLISSQVAKLFIALSVLLTYVLQYFVCLDILWNAVKDNFVKQEKLYNGLCRVVLICGSVLLAIALPNIGAFVGLIGALCFSFLGILFPVIIEIITYSGKVSALKLFLRNILILIFGVMLLCTGTYSSLLDIIKMYTSLGENVTAVNNATTLGPVASR